MSHAVVVLATAGSREEAERLAGALVQERLAACVSVVPGITSVYRWQGRLHRDGEFLLVAKSRHDLLDQLVRCIEALHSYDVPEIVALPIDGGSDRYLQWLDGEVRSG